MNDDDPQQILELLKAEHRSLDTQIELLLGEGSADQLEIARLKKRKLMLKDEIAQLNDRIVPDILACCVSNRDVFNPIDAKLPIPGV